MYLFVQLSLLDAEESISTRLLLKRTVCGFVERIAKVPEHSDSEAYSAAVWLEYDREHIFF